MTDNAQPVTRIIVACDESGAKGYADLDEATPGEVGLFAGIMAPHEFLETITPEFDGLVQRHAPANGKLHIADLIPSQQQSLRNELFALIRKYELPCFYEAIHVAGFHRWFRNHKATVEKMKQSRRSPIKISGRSVEPSSLHVALFGGLYSKVIAFCLERQKTNLDIEFRTDMVDSPIARNFKLVSEELLDYGAKIKRVTGFDPNTKQVVSGTITVTSTQKPLPITVENLEIKVAGDADGLILAADVLANSLLHLFMTRPPEEKFSALNLPVAFARHPLRDCLDTFYRWDGFNFPDTVYAHPKEPSQKADIA